MTVQLYDSGGAAVGTTGSATLSPQTSFTFGTGSSASLFLDQNLGAPVITSGFATISATSKYIACSALVMDNSVNPPTSMANLAVIAKFQKGQ